MKPFKVFRSSSDINRNKDISKPFDYIICTNKALDPESLPSDIAGAVTTGSTTIVLIQNGVGAEECIRRSFAKNTIITCVTWVGAVQSEPGVVDHIRGDLITMGVDWNDDIDRDLEQERIKILSELLNLGGSKVDVVDDIIAKRWEKVVWNAAWNSYTALTMLNTKNFLDSSKEALLISRRLMTEIISVARAAGMNLSYDLVDELIDRTLESKNGLTSSMMVDLANNRPMEVEVILGNPMRTARKLQVPTPTLDTIYTLVKAQDWRVRNNKSKV